MNLTRFVGFWTFALKWLPAFSACIGCSPEIQGFEDPFGLDRDPPYLVSVEPSGMHVDPTLCLGLTFSERIDPDSLQPGQGAVLPAIVLLEGDADPDAVEQAGRGEDYQADFEPVAARMKLAKAGTAVVLCPLEQLKDDTPYTLVVSRRVKDLARNPLCIGPSQPTTADSVVRIKTTFAGLKVVSCFPETGREGVPTNLPEVWTVFDRPVNPSSIGRGSLVLVSEQGRVEPGSVRLMDQTVLIAELNSLQPETEYWFVLDSSITAMEQGRRLLSTNSCFFSTSDGPDEKPPAILEGPKVEPYDTWAVVELTADEPCWCRTALGNAVQLEPGGFDAVASLAGLNTRFEIPLPGLEPARRYDLALSLEDMAGNVSQPIHLVFDTLPPQGKAVITEVMSNPRGPASEEYGLEYVEVYNAGSGPLDMSGWFVDDKGDRKGADLLAPGNDGSGMVLEPGARAILVASSFAGLENLAEGVLVLVADDDRLGTDGLAQSDSVELYDGDPGAGAKVQASYGGWVKATKDGVSVERKSVSGPDEASNWTLGLPGGTPGREWSNQDE